MKSPHQPTNWTQAPEGENAFPWNAEMGISAKKPKVMGGGVRPRRPKRMPRKARR
ncbi:MAG: hypothetical protein AAGI38_14665 [Bacteroidota bacterium]